MPDEFYIHKYEVYLNNGGPEEGGWTYESGEPTGFTLGPLPNEDSAYKQCRALNNLERERAEAEETYNYSSVLSYLSTHYSYDVDTSPTPEAYPQERPHYE